MQGRLAKVWPGARPVGQSWWLRQECTGCWGRGVLHAVTLGSALALVSGTEPERVQPPPRTAPPPSRRDPTKAVPSSLANHSLALAPNSSGETPTQGLTQPLRPRVCGGRCGTSQVPLKLCASTRPTRSLSTQRHTHPPSPTPAQGSQGELPRGRACPVGPRSQSRSLPGRAAGRPTREMHRGGGTGEEGGTGRGLEPAHGSSSCRKSRVCSTDRHRGVQWLFRLLGWQEAEWDLQPVLWAQAVLPGKGGGGALKSNWG